MGILKRPEALQLAKEKELDLIEISPNANPPVAKIMSFSKFKYEQSKKEREANQKSKHKEMKEMRFKPFIGVGDFNHKINQVRQFLEGQHGVKIVVKSIGRSTRQQEQELIDRIITSISDIGGVESTPRREGKTTIFQIRPIKK